MSPTKFRVTGLLTAVVLILAVEIIGSQANVNPGLRLGGRLRRSPKWSLGSSRSSATSKPSSSSGRATSAPVRATPRPATHRATTAAPVRHTTSGFRKATTVAHPIMRTTSAPHYPTQPWYPQVVHTTPRPMYPVLPHPPPIFVPPPPPVAQPPTIVIIRDSTPKPPTSSILIFGGGISSNHQSFRPITSKPKTTTTTTTTTRRPKTTTEIPWKEVDGGLDLKAWHDFVKSTQKKDIPLSGQWVRVRGGPSMREGYVEIVGEGGQWGSVCDEPASWDLSKASVVCRQLGFTRGAEAAWQGRPANNVPIPTAHVRKVSCKQNALSLLHCNLRRSKDSNFPDVDENRNCHENTRNVGVRCRPEPNTVCNFGERPFGKSCYRVVLPPAVGYQNELAKLGAEAVGTCRKSRAELVSVTTQAENDFLSDWLQTEYPTIHQVLTSGVGNHAKLSGIHGPLQEWWLWQGQFKNIDYERWWPGWTSKATITPIVPAKGMLCVVMEDTFEHAGVTGGSSTTAWPLQSAGYFYWKAYSAESRWAPLPFICEREANNVGCLRPNEEYMGPANISASGKVCLPWDLPEIRLSSILVMSSMYDSFVRERVLSGHNACRRVTMDKEPWCFVSPGAGLPPQPEQCDIPVCGRQSEITSYYEAIPKINTYYAPSFVPFNITSGSVHTQTYSALDTSSSVTYGAVFNSAQPTFTKTKKRLNINDLIMPLSLDIPAVPKTLSETVNYESPMASLNTSEVTNNTQTSGDTDTLDAMNALMAERLAETEKGMNAGEDDTAPRSIFVRPKMKFRVLTIPHPVKMDGISSDSISSTTVSTDRELTYPPVPTSLPSLSYPHPQESEPTTTEEQTTATPKPSLYSNLAELPSRYAVGKGKPLKKALSSSDLFLILNGVLPQEHNDDFDSTSGIPFTDPSETEESLTDTAATDTTTLPENGIPDQQNPDSNLISTDSTDGGSTDNAIAVPTDSVPVNQTGQVDNSLNEIEGLTTTTDGGNTDVQPSGEPTLSAEHITESVQPANTEETEGPTSTIIPSVTQESTLAPESTAAA